MALWKVFGGKKKRKYLNALDIQVLDIANRFKRKNLEYVLQEIGTGSAQSVANLEHRVDQLSNPNLLINGYFKNPVNQRGKSEYDIPSGVKKYTIDRWCETLGGTITLTDEGIQYKRNTEGKRGAFCQPFENNLPYGTYTLSFKKDGEIFSFTHYLGDYLTTNSEDDLLRFETEQLQGYVTVKGVEISIKIDCDDTILLEWAKLEIGDKATPFVPRPYAEELALCQRYFLGGEIVGQCYSLMTNTVRFSFPTPVTMRVAPTLVNAELYSDGGDGGVIVFSNNVNPQSGFTLGAPARKINAITIQVTKTSHGLTGFPEMVVLPGNGFDAEIY